MSSNATAPAENSSNSLMPDNGDEAPNFSGREIVFGVWGGSFADACLQAYVEPFEKLTGATVTIEEYGPDVTAKVIAQKEQGVKGFDVISGCGVTDQMANMAKRGALLKYSRAVKRSTSPALSPHSAAHGAWLQSRCGLFP